MLISKESLLKKFESGALLFQPAVRKIIEDEPEAQWNTEVKPDPELIRTARKKAGLTQKELAKRINVTQSAIALWETGKAKPGYNNMIALVNALGVGKGER